MTKTYSGRRAMLRLFAAMTAVTLVCLLGCGGYALYSTQQELVFCNDAAMDVYFSGMLHTLEDLEQFCNNIYYQDSGFHVLGLDPEVVTQEQSLLAWNNVRLMIRSRVTSNTALMVFDGGTSERYYSMGGSFLGGYTNRQTIAVMDQVREFWAQQTDPEAVGWQVLVTDTPEKTAILTRAQCLRNIYICAMVDVQTYGDAFEQTGPSSITYAFLTSERVLTNEDYARSQGISLEQMLRAADGRLHINGFDYILQTRFDRRSGLGLCGIISTQGIWGNWWVFIGLLVLAFLVVCGTFGGIYLYAKRILIAPLRKIQEVSRQIADGAASVQVAPERMEEIARVQDALQVLVGQKILLETEKMRQESQKEHAMLQYYQLQTRSHFLLNCLKSLYHLTARGDQENTLRIITRFSNHIRYVFHDSLTLVPIRAELVEVDDYFEIIDLERTDHILLTRSVDPALLEYPVPPLLIQTFLENFQKHNPQNGRVLHFAIQIDRVELEGQAYVRIRMTDNGSGYSDEALDQLQRLDAGFAQFHVGIQNLCRRIEILYGQRHRRAFYNLPNGGACSVFYLPWAATNGGPGKETDK